MQVCGIDLALKPMPAPLPMFYGEVNAVQWSNAAEAFAQQGGRLLSFWGCDHATRGASVCAAYALSEGLVWLELPLKPDDDGYPDLVPQFRFAERMQRAVTDLCGIAASNAADARPWLAHGAWPDGYFPLRQLQSRQPASGDAAGIAEAGSSVTDYPFVRVEGDGVHEIPVGPVHAGIIEPGHFRFSIVGEKVLRLEERLGYTHKGVEKRFTGMAPLDAVRLAGRVSGDSTVAYAWAYSMALESAAGIDVPKRAVALRALMLERERVANHLGDLGALGNDAGLAFGLAQFSRLREDWLRESAQVFGHRLMMDCIVPGGVAADIDHSHTERMQRHCDQIEYEIGVLRSIYDEHAGLQDRFIGTGTVNPSLAERLGLTGLAGRASGQANDLRCEYPWQPYDRLDVNMATRRNGDVAARVAVRFEELDESLRLMRTLCADLPNGHVRTEVAMPALAARGAGWVEGWRGQVLVALELDGESAGSKIVRCHCHDPSWQNWPVLEHAVIGNIVPDFPLINKSFNLSYSGHDL